ncbi:MAG: 6-hydroxymethylpterin diphosphokinase MptE-like protein [Planctomycetota bacterium]
MTTPRPTPSRTPRGGPPIPPDAAILERNLRALAQRSPEAAAALRGSHSAGDAVFTRADDGAITGRAGPEGRALGSQRRPLTEAERVAASVEIETTGAAVSLGFGLGYHVKHLAERMGTAGVVLAVEPDLPVLRAVLERIDHSDWLGGSNIAILHDPDDGALMTQRLTGVEGIVTLGVAFAEHPADKTRLAGRLSAFHGQFQRCVRSIRSQVLTSLMQVETTIRNTFQNAALYAAQPGIAHLHNALKGRTGVVISAGPSLRRAIPLLKDPLVRDRVCLVAVQTALKPLLSAGIRPHFVTALDHADISRRFYEGMAPGALRGITLVCEAKGNPAIPAAFRAAGGETILSPADEHLDRALGPGFVPGDGRANRALLAGATVAHLAAYLVRHLGCDPLVLVGQDLGFTDGQYYAAGAAIHDVWASELNPFRSLEMLEWERIVRQGGLLIRREDSLGRPVYTDEQMNSYLVQFERDFRADRAKGLSIIDTTDGGVRKSDTEPVALAEAMRVAIERAEGAPSIDETLEHAAPPAAPCDDPARVAERLEALARECRNVGRCSRDAGDLLDTLANTLDRVERANAIIEKINKVRDRAMSLEPGYGLIQHFNQVGTLKRFKADRAMHLDTGLSAEQRQERQVERDRDNVRWLADASDAVVRVLENATGAIRGERDAQTRAEPSRETLAAAGLDTRGSDPLRIAAVIPVDPDRSVLGVVRPLDEPLVLGLNPLRLTLERLARSHEVREAILTAQDAPRAAEIAGLDPATLEGTLTRPNGGPPLRVRVMRTETNPLGERRAAIASARQPAPGCWRGGIAGLTVFDEIADPASLARVMEQEGLDAAVPLGPAWCLVDPAHIDAVVKMHAAQPHRTGFAFTHAAPGLAVCVLARETVAQLAAASDRGGPFASVGGLLGYVPDSPRPDPIGSSVCAPVAEIVRDLPYRAIPDTEQRRTAIARAIEDLGPELLDTSAERLASRLAGRLRTATGAAPLHTQLELCTGRRSAGLRYRWTRRDDEQDRPPIDLSLARGLLQQLGAARPDACLTLAGLGDPLLHPELDRIVEATRESGIPWVHVRTDLTGGVADAERLLALDPDVVSIDVMATDEETYRTLMGGGASGVSLGDIERGVERLADRFRSSMMGGIGRPWIVPRITRCDLVYDQIEPFYNRWLRTTGSCAIDPLPTRIPGDRIEPLPLPTAARMRRRRNTIEVRSDGTVVSGGSLRDAPLGELWRRVQQAQPETAAAEHAA